jgi:hypothetical protein
MKKIILTSIVALLFAAASFAGSVITIKIELGKKSLSNCPGFGFCSISIGLDYQDGMKSTLNYDADRATVIIGIPESELLRVQPGKLIYFKDKSSVVFTEDYTVPQEIITAVKANKPIIIKKGEYPMNYSKGIYFIEFPL